MFRASLEQIKQDHVMLEERLGELSHSTSLLPVQMNRHLGLAFEQCCQRTSGLETAELTKFIDYYGSPNKQKEIISKCAGEIDQTQSDCSGAIERLKETEEKIKE